MPAKKKVTGNKQSLRANALKKQVTSSSLRAKRSNPKKEIATKPAASRNDKKVSSRISLSVPVYSLAGRTSGTMSLPKEIFGAPVNKQLLSQAVRVYMTNENVLPGNTKTRGQVEGSSAKIYRQKGTGRARHGSIRANLFVGGGIVFGPKRRKVILDLPKKMKKAALISALSSKASDFKVYGLSGIEKSSGKTKEIFDLLGKISGKGKKLNALIITAGKQDNVFRAVANIPSVTTLPANLINTYEVLKHDLLLLTKEAAEKLEVKK